jgi:hypothetical protein
VRVRQEVQALPRSIRTISRVGGSTSSRYDEDPQDHEAR